MSKKKKESISDAIAKMTSELNGEVQSENTASGYVPSIVEFCFDPKYLGFGTSRNPYKPYKMQMAVLKVFYRNSIGNEDIELTDEEIELLKNAGLYDEKEEDSEEYDGAQRGNILKKYFSKEEFFNDLVLIWGRRSGKDFVASIIALYEALKLLEVEGGDPHRYYNVAPGEPISILTIANSEGQAGISFNMIKQRLRTCPYFKDKYLARGLKNSKLYLLTPKDIEENKILKERGEDEDVGSVVIEVGHSNSDSLLGKGCFVLILDEVASYTHGTGGSGSGERIYTAMTPTINTFKRIFPVFDEDGNQIFNTDGTPKTRTVYEGKRISISSPRSKEGKLWELYAIDPKSPRQIMCRLPTWEVDPLQTRDSLRAANPDMSETQFSMEFGAEFSGTSGETMFDRDSVNAAFIGGMKFRNIGEPGKTYFVHIDPASNSHNYALVVCHKEIVLDQERNRADFAIIVDEIKYWSPSDPGGINVEVIDDYVLSLRRRYHLGLVTYDNWDSTASIQKMRKYGLPAKKTHYNSKYKMMIYTELESLLASGKIKIPHHKLLKDEMINLQRKYRQDTGFRVFAKNDPDGCNTDDIVDALAGAVYNCLSASYTKLPKARTVASPGSGENQIAWRNMQGGIYGIGSGQKVASDLEKRASWPQYKRR